jgi:hypothetical protein
LHRKKLSSPLSKILDNLSGDGVEFERSSEKDPVETEKTLSARYAEVIRLRQAIENSQAPAKSSGEKNQRAPK